MCAWYRQCQGARPGSGASTHKAAGTAAIAGNAAAALAAMRPDAIIINVGRGGTIDETALYQALQSGQKSGQIGGAIIDTWYRYPSPETPNPHPASLPFHTLSNGLMTPHMSGWTAGTIRRRRDRLRPWLE